MSALQVGYNLSTSAHEGADPARDAAAAEAAGFDFVSLSDHLHGEHPTFETWTMLTWAAAATSRVRLVTNVLGLPYRHPPVLAKMAESLHRLSGGRLVLGLGAGGNDVEFDAFGLAGGAGKRQALDDAIVAMRALWREADVDLETSTVHLRGATITPRATTSIPIWVGAYGPKMLELVGRQADGWLPSMPYVPPERMPALRDAVHRAAEAAGRDPAAIVHAYNVPVHVGRPSDRPGVVAGPSEAVVERLRDLAGTLGRDAINVWPVGDEERQRPLLAELLADLRA